MPGFKLYSSNRQEELLKHLAAEVLSKPPLPPLTTEYIVVQHQGIQRWVSTELTKYFGILANTRFLFPNELAQIVFDLFVPGYRDDWNAERLRWFLLKLLLTLPDNPEFVEVREFQKVNKELKSYQLAEQLGSLFEQYDMFRPAIMEEWENKAGTSWQHHLHRSLPQTVRSWRKSTIRQSFWQALESLDKIPEILPKRLTFLGISYLPPLHLDILKGLSQLIDVHFFFLNPTPYYWGDLIPEKKIIRESLKNKNRVKEDLHMEAGNPLLASWGRYGQVFFNSLFELDISKQEDLFIQAPDSRAQAKQTGLLQAMQQDIFELANPERGVEADTLALPEKDTSFQIHICHSPMREVEVLKDNLLMMFSEEAVRPEEVLVMTPDIELYAPLIQAVFSTDLNAGDYIPYSISDRVFVKESIILQYLLKLFEILKGRFTIADVLSLFASKAVREKFQLSLKDLNTIQEWLESVNIRWGIDENLRNEKGVPPTYENTWQFGIDRILTGFCIPGQGRHLITEKSTYHQILPFDHIEGNSALMFGRFLDYFAVLVSLAPNGEQSVFQKRTISQWVLLFETIIESLFKTDPDWSNEFLIIRQTLDELRKVEEDTAFDTLIGIEPLLEHLKKQFNSILNERGYSGQGVTFAAMKPMRSIPFKVIALVGLNDKAFPRTDHSLSFDLSGDYIKGDRSMKGEDQYLFLETLICAREKLYVSYVGNSIKDNAKLPPSSLISELVDYIEQAYLSKERIEETYVIYHPLQAFSPKNYLKNGRLVSFSQQNFEAAKSLLTKKKIQREALEFGLPAVDSSFEEVSLEELIRFFSNPVKYFLNVRLNLFLDDESEEKKEDEPFDLDSLSKYLVEDKILENLKNFYSPEKTYQTIKSQGLLPHSQAGVVQFNKLSNEIDHFYRSIGPFIQQQELAPFPFELKIDRFVLHGVIGTARANQLVRFRHSRVKVKDRIQSWLEHLVVNSLKPEGYPLESVLIGLDSKNKIVQHYRTASLAQSQHFLQQLLEIYLNGVSKPLAFFPRSADAYMGTFQQLVNEDEELARDKSRKEALKLWLGNQAMNGEAEDPYFQLCFARKSLFLETDFERNCERILNGIYLHQKMDEVG